MHNTEKRIKFVSKVERQTHSTNPKAMNSENPSITFLNGKYTVNGEAVEINTSMPYLSIGDDHVEGHQAQNYINEIYERWVGNCDLTIEQAIAEFIFINGISE